MSSPHFPCLVAGIAVPLLAVSLIVVDRDRIAFRFLPHVLLPHTCPSRIFFSFDCPACGLTRSIVYLVHGQFRESLAMHRLGSFVFLLILVQVPYRLWCMSGLHPRLVASGRLETCCWIGLLVLLVLNRAFDLVAVA